MTTFASRKRACPGRRPLFTLLLAVLFAACASGEEKRIRELLHEKGFGTRAQGQAVKENYITGGDAVQFLLDPMLYLTAGAEQLSLLAAPQAISIDGTILIPYLGPVYVLGMTERELATLVNTQLQGFFNFEVAVQCRILNLGKAFYAFGEVLQKGRLPMIKGDITVLEAIATIGTSPLANLGRVRVVKPDAENPLVVVVNIREMILTGNTKWNLRLDDNDILYVPPTILGAFARFAEKLLQPLGVAVSALFAWTSLRYSYDVLSGDAPYYGYYYGF